MPGLDYPFVYVCSTCGAETTIERPDAQELHPNPDSFDAHELVLQNRGWMRAPLDGDLYCPDCTDAATA